MQAQTLAGETAIEIFRRTKDSVKHLDQFIEYLETIPSRSRPPLPEPIVKMLRYFHTVEGLVMATYDKEVQRMPSNLDPDICEFRESWTKEETRHRVAIEHVFRIHGHDYEPVVAGSMGWRYKLYVELVIAGAWVMRRTSPIIHMMSGAFNESMAKAGYTVFITHVKDYPDLAHLIGLINSEETRHKDFYEKKGFELMGNAWFKKILVVLGLLFVWKPVGSGNADIKELADNLLNTEERGETFMKQMKKRMKDIIEALPLPSNRVMAKLQSLAAG